MRKLTNPISLSLLARKKKTNHRLDGQKKNPRFWNDRFYYYRFLFSFIFCTVKSK